jgi:Uma2 family endonuclease
MALDREVVPRSPVPNPPRLFLESGDRLTRAEFERRYQAMPHVKRAELIEGVVYVASPVRFGSHGRPHSLANVWLGVYAADTPGVEVADNTTVRLDPDNEVQPDVLLSLDPSLGGCAKRTEDDYLEGPPELVMEVAASSASIDRHTKLHVYQRNRVSEYVVWQVMDQRLDWFALREGAYEPLVPDARGILHSEVFPGLRLAVAALLAGDFAAVLAEQQQGNRSAEHVAFTRRLKSET